MKKILLFTILTSTFLTQAAISAQDSNESGTLVKPPPSINIIKPTEIRLWDTTYYYQAQYNPYIDCSTDKDGYPNIITINMQNLQYVLVCPNGYAGPFYEASIAEGALPATILNVKTNYLGGKTQGGQTLQFSFSCKILQGSGQSIQTFTPDIHVKAYCLLR